MNKLDIAVSVENLQKKFGNFTAVDRISFEVAGGEIFGFLGPNGAGKSTTIKMLCGIFAPTSGNGHVAGYDILSQQDDIKENIGYMSQRFSLYEDLTVEENMNFYAGLYRISGERLNARKDWIVEMAGLKSARSSMTKNLSVGWKQRLALGCAIIHEPKILFLDEPTSGVDPIARNNFWGLIKDLAVKGVTVFVTTHYMDEAKNCGRIGFIYKGKLIALGEPDKLGDYMKEEVLKISIIEPEKYLKILRTLPFVKEAALFGASIHVLVSDAKNCLIALEQVLKKSLAKQYKVEKIEPSLEDIFVSLIESYDNGGGYQ
jgi:ABC-2 type transport system ATP-binding protein